MTQPVSISVDTRGKGDEQLAELLAKQFDFRPAAIIERLDLRKTIYRNTTNFGIPYLAWDKCYFIQLDFTLTYRVIFRYKLIPVDSFVTDDRSTPPQTPSFRHIRSLRVSGSQGLRVSGSQGLSSFLGYACCAVCK